MIIGDVYHLKTSYLKTYNNSLHLSWTLNLEWIYNFTAYNSRLKSCSISYRLSRIGWLFQWKAQPQARPSDSSNISQHSSLKITVKKSLLLYLFAQLTYFSAIFT